MGALVICTKLPLDPPPCCCTQIFRFSTSNKLLLARKQYTHGFKKTRNISCEPAGNVKTKNEE